ncbi:hypothetical protein SAMN05660657_03355 [Geodermatophilus amargosae]|uniref:Uncharacterized protein n=1 Tax=Geodermatophilus amargosae TaxID=1296565 RepID=A0A1I7B6U2_9ACTN|nr:hypothetical protein [Geodermatophilus amargosae]SFT82881.1 hypothetical protein SAMN05660657_03355 [Geodermatophilus amargosae]
MLPTLSGRIQTRIFLLAVVGSIWTLIITPVLPTEASLAASYGATFSVLLVVLVLGVLWELVYHGIQQFRWEKDWPTLFGLLTAIPEGLLVWFLFAGGAIPWIGSLPGPAFVIHFVSTWLIVWLVANGPMRVPFIHWRINGGRLI